MLGRISSGRDGCEWVCDECLLVYTGGGGGGGRGGCGRNAEEMRVSPSDDDGDDG